MVITPDRGTAVRCVYWNPLTCGGWPASAWLPKPAAARLRG